jgi:hypothetical protein
LTRPCGAVVETNDRDLVAPRLVGTFVEAQVLLVRVDLLDQGPEVADQVPSEALDGVVVHALDDPVLKIVDQQLTDAGMANAVLVDQLWHSPTGPDHRQTQRRRG